MATTYNKTLKTLEITVHGVDTAITVADTATSGVASAILETIEQGGDVMIPQSESEIFVPYHAIVKVEVTSTTSEVTKEDATCVSE